ncbi:MAG: hypothetical protein WD036_07205 [Bauldia sp.]
MRPRLNASRILKRPAAAGLLAVLAASGLLAACASNSDGGKGPSTRLFGGGVGKGVITVENPDYDPDFFLKSGYCPPVEIRAGTEALVKYEPDHEGEQPYVQHQGSITKTARECHAIAADTLTIKLGVAGRVVAGPKGGAGEVVLPLRVAVVKQHGGTVLYTEEFKVPVTVAAPAFSANFSQVIDDIVLNLAPEDRDLIVYVGFDQGPPGKDATG